MPLKGERMSEETRRKLSQALKGRPKSAEHKRKLSAASSISGKGRIVNADTREKIANSLRGRKRPPMSEKGRRKISYAIRKRLDAGLPYGAVKLKTIDEKSAFVLSKGLKETSYGRRIAREIMVNEPKMCFFCANKLNYRRWSVHHINNDESDNRRENLAWAHIPCHKSNHGLSQNRKN